MNSTILTSTLEIDLITESNCTGSVDEAHTWKIDCKSLLYVKHVRQMFSISYSTSSDIFDDAITLKSAKEIKDNDSISQFYKSMAKWLTVYAFFITITTYSQYIIFYIDISSHPSYRYNLKSTIRFLVVFFAIAPNRMLHTVCEVLRRI